LKNINPAKFHLDLSQNDRALGIFEQNNNNNKKKNNMID